MELNDDLDDIFNRLNDESNFDEPWEGAWEKMEIKLDKGYKKYPAGLSSLKKFGIGLGILSSIIIGIIIFNQSTQTKNQDINLNAKSVKNNNELIKTENRKSDLNLQAVNEIVIVDSNKNLSVSNESKTEKLATSITDNKNKPNEQLKKEVEKNFNLKSLAKPDLNSKNKSSQNISQKQKLVNSEPELSQNENKQNNKGLKPIKGLVKINPISRKGSSEINKPILNDLSSNNNDFFTNETKLKTRKNSIAQPENTLEDAFEKKSSNKVTGFNEYQTNGFRKLSKLKTDNEVVTNPQIETQSTEKTLERDIYKVNSLKKLDKVNLFTNLMFKNKPSNYTIPEPAKPTESKPNYIPTKGIALRLGYSPDISSIKGHSVEKIGNNFNALLEWRINSKWALSSGVIKSLKYYDAYPEDYNWPANWRKPPNPLLEINATCNMLDVPINIRYDFKAYRNSLFFIKSGLTSYVMLNEKYVYDYENNNDPLIKWKKWEGSTGSYRLGVINLSTGIELRYRKNIFVQIEPFAKIPIKEIGFGKVKLSTYGVFVSTKIPLINFK